MGREAPGPGTDAPGPPRVSAPEARAWAIAAAQAATRVPAAAGEADAWTVRGWADAAVGCIALDLAAGLDGPAAFSGLDEVIDAMRVPSGGQHAARLRRLRRFAGPVPRWYPDVRPVDGPVRAVRPIVWQAADLVASFGELLIATTSGLRRPAPCPLSSARQLAWGNRYRPSPSEAHLTLPLPVSRRLARRTWMCLPGLPSPATAIAEVPSTATPLAQQVWRGIHEGAHLDYVALLARFRPEGPQAPSPAEFGAGLMLTESYAMAVELLAAVECVLTGEGHAVWQLGAGLIERAARLPGGSAPAAEFADLPTLAEVYLLGPLEVLIGAGGGGTVPEEVAGPLRARWGAACAAYQPAAAFTSAAARLVSGPPGA
jgi:hypothetical protein